MRSLRVKVGLALCGIVATLFFFPQAAFADTCAAGSGDTSSYKTMNCISTAQTEASTVAMVGGSGQYHNSAFDTVSNYGAASSFSGSMYVNQCAVGSGCGTWIATPITTTDYYYCNGANTQCVWDSSAKADSFGHYYYAGASWHSLITGWSKVNITTGTVL